jgi:hypothetical protein
MIYDCFTFFNELDILELRLELLFDKVDWFVIVESTKTHSFEDKELYYQSNSFRFKKYSDKIIHIVVSDFPEIRNSWTLENYQRNQILTALQNCNPDDIILISDVDEIPNPEIITTYPFGNKVYCLVQDQYFFYFNYRDVKHLYWIGGTKVLKYSLIKNNILNEDKVRYNDVSFPAYLNDGITATKIRLYDGSQFIYNGGWHFSYLGGVDAIVKKVKAFAHQELNNAQFLDINRINECLASGSDFFGRKGHFFLPVEVTSKTHPISVLRKFKFDTHFYKGRKPIKIAWYYRASQLLYIKFVRLVKRII